ncbi:MAG: hypothetical protein WHT29_00380 [Bacteroidales bacterium]|nr:hypothetical protein [Bacteroidales bacterium]HOK97553.1 hypothetical protein [Bacteroidales bacterium]HPO64373.1 hypothetical protein [Bacteroidales bacterium]
MGLDIKYPIGLMFTLMGIVLTIYGLATLSDPTMYQKSFQININLWSGIGMLIFGVVMLALVKKKKTE